MPNRAFEIGRAEERRAAQRERYSAKTSLAYLAGCKSRPGKG